MGINQYGIASGRMLKEDDVVINVADIISDGVPTIPEPAILYDDLVSLGQFTNIAINGCTAYGFANAIDSLLSSVPFELPLYFPQTVQDVYIASTNANDTELGTGARTILITGLDENYNVQYITKNLSGLTPVSVGRLIRINALYVLIFGSNVDANGDKYPMGTIWAGVGDFIDGVPANKMRAIFTNDRADRQAIFTIPDGYNGLLKDFDLYTETTNDLKMNLFFRTYGEDGFSKLPQFSCIRGKNVFFGYAKLVLPPRTDVYMRCHTDVQESETSSNLIFYLIKIY